MKSWIRITSVVFILIGGTIFFGHWSLLQFDNALNIALNNSSVFNVANTLSASSPIEINDEVASSSPITDDGQTSTTSPEISATFVTSTSTTLTDLNLSFTFPKRGDELYIGCTYQISWQSSTIVDSLGVALMDAGTGKIAGPVASGLARENKIETDSQNLNWKVGVVWPGGYYIKVSKINGIEADYKSKFFVINKMSTNISTDERENICEESGGSLF